MNSSISHHIAFHYSGSCVQEDIRKRQAGSYKELIRKLSGNNKQEKQLITVGSMVIDNYAPYLLPVFTHHNKITTTS